ncbi:MAG: hypothetical protein R6V23_09010 [Bacteroidales bacterium]
MKLKIFSKKQISLFILLFALSTINSLSNDTIKQNDIKRDRISNGKISIFLDLEHWADDDYIRQEIPVVNFVRDKENADLHIIMTSHDAGQAGTNYIISFIGRQEFSGINHELKYWSSANQTRHEVREGYTRMIKIGLIHYMADNEDFLEKISIQYLVDSLELTDEDIDVVDPWRSWVFEVYGGGYFDAEQTRNSLHIRYGFYADKVTEDWKIRARPYFNYNEKNYEIEDSTTITTTSRRDGFDGYLIKSLSDHWSYGVFTEILSSTYHNMDFQLEVSPAIEYSIFPYSEATRRSIAIAYKLDYSYNNYIQRTIFDESEEFLWGHSLVLSADFQQPWGSIRARMTGKQHFHDFSSNRLEMYTQLNLRLFKGFALTVAIEFDYINDLVEIPMGEMSTEEILLEQRRRSTNYQLDGHIGFTYTFGSKFSAAYNPRL